LKLIPFRAEAPVRFNHVERRIEGATRVPEPRRDESQAKRESVRVSPT
jgi:hypothetical protein